VNWLVVSLVLSAVLTVVLNVALRVFPRAGERLTDGFDELASPESDGARRNERRTRVFFPWRAMIIASVVLTVLINLAIWLL
jgi:hypothetical protein